jgi:hypothetical protein
VVAAQCDHDAAGQLPRSCFTGPLDRESASSNQAHQRPVPSSHATDGLLADLVHQRVTHAGIVASAHKPGAGTESRYSTVV